MSYDIVQENVPFFERRIGDHVIQGSNNSIIILGTDRASNGVAKLDSGLGNINSPNKGMKAGSCHIIVGRKDDKGNPDFDKDSAYFYISMNTEVDKNLEMSVEGDSGPSSASVMKADAVRMLARKDVKIMIDKSQSYVYLSNDSCIVKIDGVGFIKVEKGTITVDADNIKLGKNATERVLKGETFQTAFNTHTHTCAVGPTSPPIKPTATEVLSSRKVMAE